MRCQNKHVLSSNKVLLFEQWENKPATSREFWSHNSERYFLLCIFFKPRLCHFVGLKSPAHMAFEESSALLASSEGGSWPPDTDHIRAAGTQHVSSTGTFSSLLFFSSLTKMFWGQGTGERVTAVRSLGLCSMTRLCLVPLQCSRWWVTFYCYPYLDLQSLRACLEVLALGLLY